MPVLDQINTFSRGELTGSAGDDVYFGNILQTDPALSGGFVRERIASAATRTINTTLFDQKNLTYNQRLRYISGSFIPGISNVQFSQLFSENEKFFDSFTINPVDVAKANGVVFPYIGDSGSLGGSPLHGIPGAADNAVSLFLSDRPSFTVNQSSTILDEIVDLDWTIAKWPFRRKYQNLNRIFNPSIKLPEPVEQTKTFTGTVVTPASKSSNLGSVYYVTDERIKIRFPIFRTGISSSSGFTLAHLPVPGTSSGFPSMKDLDVCISPDPSDGSTTAVFMSVGGNPPTVTGGETVSGSCVYKSSDGLGVYWENITPTNILSAYPTAHLRGVAHSVDDAGNDPWEAWAVVGSNGVIFVNTSTKDPTKSGWVDKTGATGNTLWDVSFNDPTGIFVSANFAAVGSGGTVVTSSDKSGTSWTQVGTIAKPNTKDLYCITYNVATQRFVAAGLTTIWRSNNRLGSSWSEVLAPGAQFFDISSGSPTSQTIIAVGDDGLFSGFIYRSANGGVTWTNVTPAGASNVYGISPGSPNDDFDWIAVGVAAKVYISRDDGLTWQRQDAANIGIELENWDYLWRIKGAAIDANSNQLETLPNNRYIAIGNSRTMDRNVIFRVADYTSNAYFTGSNSNLKNEIVSLRRGGAKPGRDQDLSIIATGFDELYKSYFGFGDGITVDFSDQGPELFNKPFATTYLRKKAIGYFDETIYNPASLQGSVESVRTHATRIRGWGYGMINALPQSSKTIWRRDRFGQFRDMLEQRAFSKMFAAPSNISSDVGSLDGAVSIRFVSGSVAASASLNQDFTNPTDSGQFDVEYRSGQPFFDDVDLTLFR